MAKDLGKTSTGIEANVAGVLSYVLGWITGLIFFLIEKDNKFVRFHALQSILVFGALTAAMIIIHMLGYMLIVMRLGVLFPLLGLLSMLLWLASIILWVILMVKAYQGENFKLPVAGDIAERQVK